MSHKLASSCKEEYLLCFASSHRRMQMFSIQLPLPVGGTWLCIIQFWNSTSNEIYINPELKVDHVSHNHYIPKRKYSSHTVIKTYLQVYQKYLHTEWLYKLFLGILCHFSSDWFSYGSRQTFCEQYSI